MTEDPNDPKPPSPKQRVAGVIGGVLGVSVGLALGKLLDFESLWFGALLVGGCTGISIFLAQKIASK